MRDAPGPSLAAVLIARDEAATLPGCLASLTGVVDTVHVHDTGSVDGTPELAASLGAVVSHGAWTDDFAAARNAALARCAADWVLSVDADERIRADPGRLRDLLAGTPADVLLVDVDNDSDEIAYTHRAARLFRPARAGWAGRVHEQLVAHAGRLVTEPVDRSLLVLRHLGYGTADARRAKSARNAALAQARVDELVAAGAAADPGEVADVLLDLGRSFVGAGRGQDAVDTFETLRDMFPGTRQWVQATDFLARLVLAAGLDEVCLELSEQLRTAGVRGTYCDWLAAQALAQLGEVERAWTLLTRVEEVVDTRGLRYDPTALAQLTELVGRLRTAARSS